jgi:hypothetical protein
MSQPHTPTRRLTRGAVAYGAAALVLGLLVPALAFAGLTVAGRTALHVTVACLMPVLVGMSVWSATRTTRPSSGRARGSAVSRGQRSDQPGSCAAPTYGPRSRE